MKLASSKLRAWQRENDLTDTEAGAAFGTTRMTWLRWKNGEMVPGPAFMIELFTRGVACPNDFYDLPDPAISKAAA